MLTDAEMLRDALESVVAYQADPQAQIAHACSRRHRTASALIPTRSELEQTLTRLGEPEQAAMELLAGRLDLVNRSLMATIPESISIDGLALHARSIRRVGVCIPYGYPSSVYTYLSAARAAGVSELVVYLVTDKATGCIDPLSLAAARRYEAEILAGPAGVGFLALAFGTPDGSLRCHKICGPCGRRQNILKFMSALAAGCDVDFFAGPSNVAVAADGNAPFDQVTLDLEAQLEHGVDSRSHLVLVGEAAREQWKRHSGRRERAPDPRIAVCQVEGPGAAIETLDELAPETVELWLDEAEAVARALRAGGVVYVRQASSVGDFGAIGRGCADPTDGLASAQSGLSPLTFLRWCPVVSKGPEETALGAAATLARYERFESHGSAITGFASLRSDLSQQSSPDHG